MMAKPAPPVNETGMRALCAQRDRLRTMIEEHFELPLDVAVVHSESIQKELGELRARCGGCCVYAPHTLEAWSTVEQMHPVAMMERIVEANEADIAENREKCELISGRAW
jgi:hypothetical protein